MWASIRGGAVAFHKSFHSSAVIWFARAQILMGAIWGVLTVTDLSPLIGNPKYVTAWLVFSGIVTEMSRRAHTVEDEEGRLRPVPRDNTINVVVNNAAPPSVDVPASPVPTAGNTK